jgi:hypothetical protein
MCLVLLLAPLLLTLARLAPLLLLVLLLLLLLWYGEVGAAHSAITQAQMLCVQ